jgi:hypothetical protein
VDVVKLGQFHQRLLAADGVERHFGLPFTKPTCLPDMQIEDFDNITFPWPDEGKAWSGLPMARVALRAAFYLGNCYSKEARAPLMAVVEEYLAMAGSRIRAYQRADDRRRLSAGPGRPVDVERLRDRVANFKTPWAIEASGEEDINVASQWSMVAVADHEGYILAHFPLEAFKSGARETFRGMFQRWCSSLNVQHAYAGLASCCPWADVACSVPSRRWGHWRRVSWDWTWTTLTPSLEGAATASGPSTG